MAPDLGRRPLLSLPSATLFARASVEHGTVVWPGVIDIAPETLYDRSVPVAHEAVRLGVT